MGWPKRESKTNNSRGEWKDSICQGVKESCLQTSRQEDIVTNAGPVWLQLLLGSLIVT